MIPHSDSSDRSYAENIAPPERSSSRYSSAAIRGFLVVVAIALLTGFFLGKCTGSWHNSHSTVTTVTVTAHPPTKSRSRSIHRKSPQNSVFFPTSNESAPANVLATLAQIDAGAWPPRNDTRTHGGTRWQNRGGQLPEYDGQGNLIEYREWDVNIHQYHHTRDGQRIITGSDRSAYYTLDHYITFTKIR